MTDSTTDKLPRQFDEIDGWNESAGIEQCPVCERVYSPNGGYTGPVYDQDGTRYQTPIDPSPDDGPFFCESCWPELEANRKQSENQSLGDFA